MNKADSLKVAKITTEVKVLLQNPPHKPFDPYAELWMFCATFWLFLLYYAFFRSLGFKI
jgi:hypothetical protein